MAAESYNRGPKLGEATQQVSERVSTLVREEIELAKAELTVKGQRLARGIAAGAAAGIFVTVGLLFLLHGVAWLLNEEVFDSTWLGFFVTAVLLFILAAIAGFLAYRFVKKAMPPTPELAIREGKLIRETVQEARS